MKPMNSPRFNVPTALDFARQGRIEEWIHTYLNTGQWANPGFSEGLKLQQRWWKGPLELPLSILVRAVGPEPGMEYPVTDEYWSKRTGSIAESIRSAGLTPLDLPPLIAHLEFTPVGDRVLSVRDGNHRLGAYERLGWPAAWVIVWYDREEDFQNSPV